MNTNEQSDILAALEKVLPLERLQKYGLQLVDYRFSGTPKRASVASVSLTLRSSQDGAEYKVALEPKSASVQGPEGMPLTEIAEEFQATGGKRYTIEGSGEIQHEYPGVYQKNPLVIARTQMRSAISEVLKAHGIAPTLLTDAERNAVRAIKRSADGGMRAHRDCPSGKKEPNLHTNPINDDPAHPTLMRGQKRPYTGWIGRPDLDSGKDEGRGS